MKKYLFVFLTVATTFINILAAESVSGSCSCKNCKCVPEKHCGCYSEDGCHNNGTECPGCPDVEKEPSTESKETAVISA